MHIQIIPPSSLLAPYIQHYWVLESHLHDDLVQERVVPTGNIEIIFHYRKPFCSISSRGVSFTQPRSMISGVKNSWFDVRTTGESGALAVTFLPGAAANFFNLPMMELEGRSLHLADTLNHTQVLTIEDQLAEASGLTERIRIIEGFLIKKLRPFKAFDQHLIQKGVCYILKHKGQIKARELAQNLCVTPKTLERKFACYVGSSPKQFIKILRFYRAMSNLTSANTGSLTQHALANGYFDQAHFIKDFKSYAGFTPKEMLSHKYCNGLNLDIKPL